MGSRHIGLWAIGLVLVLTSAQPAVPYVAAAEAQQTAPQERPTFSVQIDLVTTDVVARDANGNFVADLTRDDFDVYEDGVKQQIVSLTLSHGGRVSNLLAPPPPPAPEGIILPAVVRRSNDMSGRIFVFFIDDLHLQFQNGPRVKTLLRKMEKVLLHEGDLFGIVSTGTSSISVQPTYDKKRFEEMIEKISGDELKPSEIVNGPTSQDGPSEVRHRARVAMDTVNELLDNLEKLHDRRKAIVYISDGYDFIPFQNARLGLKMDASSPFLLNQRYRDLQNDQQSNGQDPNQGTSTAEPNPAGSQQQQQEEFADADLALELARITRNANRANATIYTIDPRGLIGLPDFDELVEPRQWSEFIRKSQDTLRELADDTGGIAVVNQNDFDKALNRIDAEASDYYVLGYYSSNPDPTRRLRTIDVRANRRNVTVVSRKEYLVKPPVRPRSKR